jgi:hypothetical protein
LPLAMNALSFSIVGIIMLMPATPERHRATVYQSLTGALILLIPCLGCGGAAASAPPTIRGTASGDYTLSVTARSGNIRSSVNLTLRVL